MKIGIMGGTFDPIHIGHLILGENAWQQLGLDTVIYMPAGNPPHKQHREGRATDRQRMDMVQLATTINPHFVVSGYEMNEDGFSYTHRTLEHMHKVYPDSELYFIIGADSLFDFDTWREPQKIADLSTLVVATRNHTSTEKMDAAIRHVREKYHADVIRLDTENIDVSSKMIREWIRDGHSIRYYVTADVEQYIMKYRLYRRGDDAGQPRFSNRPGEPDA